jgi:hypothetical protein
MRFQKFLSVVLMLPMFILGNVLKNLLFRPASTAAQLFFVAWFLLISFAAYYLCRKDGEIVMLRFTIFFFFGLAALAGVLLFLG